MSVKPRILILIGAFWPGHEASGPNLSIKAQCEALSDQFDFLIVARDRPFGESAPTAKTKGWHDVGYARACYLPVGRLGAKGLAKLLRKTPHDLLVLNGFFDREFTIPALIARRFGRGSAAPVLLSPRGEFTGGALALKAGRKAGFLKLAEALDLHRGVHVHVTSEAEAADCKAVLPDLPATLIPNFRPIFALPQHTPRPDGAPLRLAFLGRISPVKGVDLAIEALLLADVPARFDICGPVSDADYWTQCEAQIARLPAHIVVQNRGVLANADAAAMLAAHDALLLPSLSENFGHAIFESLAAGTPVIIGDQTPWRGLADAQAGFDVSAGNPQAFADAIRRFAALADPAEWRAGARARAEAFVAGSDARAAMSRLFTILIGGRALASPPSAV
jgi:glycosyltransferase involved in cell wall biosynthesis